MERSVSLLLPKNVKPSKKFQAEAGAQDFWNDVHNVFVRSLDCVWRGTAGVVRCVPLASPVGGEAVCVADECERTHTAAATTQLMATFENSPECVRVFWSPFFIVRVFTPIISSLFCIPVSSLSH